MSPLYTSSESSRSVHNESVLCRCGITTVLAPSCGYYADQRKCLTYASDETGLDRESLRAAIIRAYDERPAWRAEVPQRRAERQAIAAAHRALYERLLR